MALNSKKLSKNASTQVKTWAKQRERKQKWEEKEDKLREMTKRTGFTGESER